MNPNDKSNQKTTIINKIKNIFKKDKKNKIVLNNEINDILNQTNQNNNMNQTINPSNPKGNIIEKIKIVFTQKEKRKIIIAISVLVIALITLILSITFITNNSKKTLKKNSWSDFIISIDGNTVKLGEKISNVESFGFTTTEENYKSELGQTFTSGGIPFIYKNDDKTTPVYFSAYNKESKNKPVPDCELNGIEIQQEFYKKYDVILPKGIKLTDTLNITEIINKWGKPTTETENSFSWIKDDKEIRIYTKKDKTIFSIVYDA